MFTFEIEYVNRYGHIEGHFIVKKKTERAAIMAAKKDKDLYPGCWIEVICFETRKRIYA